MASNFQAISGLRELGEAFKLLKADMQTRVARAAVGAGAQVMKAAVITKASQQPTLADKPFKFNGQVEQPGLIARNVIVKRVTSSDLTSEFVVAVRSNRKNGYVGRLASHNEFGTVDMAAQPFMRPAFESTASKAAGTIVKTLDKRIQQAATKVPRRKKA